ncbi:hypothetical protein LIA77_08397 [Sarocladium implicatum]|nr:hypothetical protein LIA77_08397 [Sarocladium implicatum]
MDSLICAAEWQHRIEPVWQSRRACDVLLPLCICKAALPSVIRVALYFLPLFVDNTLVPWQCKSCHGIQIEGLDKVCFHQWRLRTTSGVKGDIEPATMPARTTTTTCPGHTPS